MHLIFLLFLLILGNNSLVMCTVGDIDEELIENHWNKDDNIYMTEIKTALNEYVPCNATKCQCHKNVIRENLKPFMDIGGITKEMINKVQKYGTKYQIINHRLYRQENCLFPARCLGIEHFLKKLLLKLSNTEMIINCRDWPQIIKPKGHQNVPAIGPVFSFSKTDEYLDILYPTWSFWEGGPAISLYPTGLGRWDKHLLSISQTASNEYKWKNKIDKGFFRGSRTSNERDSLVLLSRAQPDLVDAQYTKNQAWKSPADTLNYEPAKEVSLEQHCLYKYLFNFRGVAASFRFKHLFLCKSLVFHVGNEWQEFFYSSLKPWVHYVPVPGQPTADDLQKLIHFFQKHDSLAKDIADRGFEHIWTNLNMKNVDCFWRKLLKSYAKLLRFEVVRDDTLIEIK